MMGKRGNFAQIPNVLLQVSPDVLSPLAVKLYCDLFSRSGGINKDGSIHYKWLSLNDVGKMIGISNRSFIKKYVDELKDFGLLVTKDIETNTGRPIQEYIPIKIDAYLTEKLKGNIPKKEKKKKETKQQVQKTDDNKTIEEVQNEVEKKLQAITGKKLNKRQDEIDEWEDEFVEPQVEKPKLRPNYVSELY